MNSIFNLLRFVILLISITFTYLAYTKHQGQAHNYIIFSFLINLLFLYSLNKKKLFFEIFFAGLLWLGFWFRYTMSLIFYNGIVYDSGPHKNINNIDEALLVANIAFMAIFLAYLVRQKIFKNKNSFIASYSFFEKIYLKKKNFILFTFFSLFTLISYINFKFSIYQKGFIYPLDLPYILIIFVKWMMLFGLTTLSCFFVNTEIIRLKKISTGTIIIMLIEIFASYTSMLSRLLVFVQSSILFSIIKYFNLIKNKSLFVFIILTCVLLMFFFNNLISNHYRINYAIDINSYLLNKQEYLIKKESLNNITNNDNLTKKEKEEEIEKIENKKKPGRINTSLFLIVNRWVGIDSLLAVVSSGKLNFNLFFESLKEKKTTNELTFYEKNFDINFDKGKVVEQGEKRILKGNTLPGIIAFIFYSGNYIFLFFSLFVIIFFFMLIEILSLKISNNNYIFSAFISFSTSFRLMNFGYAPKDSYMYLLSIAGAMILIFILTKKIKFKI